MMSPSGLIRARSISTNGLLAAMPSGSMPWQLVPWARMIFCALALHQVFHRPRVLGGPVQLLHAVEQDDVDVVDAQLHAVALDVAAGVGVLGRVGLGLDHVLVAGDALERLAEIDVRAVLVGDVEEADAPVERVADDPGEFLDAQPGLVARLARADGCRSPCRRARPGCPSCPGSPCRSGSWAGSPARRRTRSWTRRPGQWSRRSLAKSRGDSGATSWRIVPPGEFTGR